MGRCPGPRAAVPVSVSSLSFPSGNTPVLPSAPEREPLAATQPRGTSPVRTGSSTEHLPGVTDGEGSLPEAPLAVWECAVCPAVHPHGISPSGPVPSLLLLQPRVRGSAPSPEMDNAPGGLHPVPGEEDWHGELLSKWSLSWWKSPGQLLGEVKAPREEILGKLGRGTKEPRGDRAGEK